MNNNDILIRLRYTFDIKDSDMLDIFDLGGVTLTLEELRVILKNKNLIRIVIKLYLARIWNVFLNGFIISQRGVKRDKAGRSTCIFRYGERCAD